ncbi:MAG TPA: hypothetical protein PKL15_10980 [Saprospiraceae bacterium]|nr:hypothetical protein [Saprospiraceae bacterium]HNL37973.1 hypothetical protein [Saprospiraceae bacterium]HNM25949.1 hypothetical protein [Saprospiraceae bacterium]
MTTKSLLTWSPRILVLAFALFVSVFALDAWSEGGSFGHRLLAFLIHLLPTAAILGALYVAWRWRIIGGLVFMVLGMIFTVYFAAWRTTELFLMLSMPLFLSGVLFIFSNWNLEKT